MATDPLTTTRVEKAAGDSGFDIAQNTNDGWLEFGSSHCPIKIWINIVERDKLSSLPERQFFVAFSSSNISDGLLCFGNPTPTSLPAGAVFSYLVTGISELFPLLKRAFQLSRALPNEPLIEFEKQIRGLPQSTEVERTVIQRVGQDIFRERLIEFWDGKCAVTGLAIPALLRASHIKPWSECATDAERLDVFNGILLAPHLDAVFDRGFITFGDDGSLVVSKHLGHEGLKTLGIDVAAKCDRLTAAHRKYLAWHRANEFQGK